MCRSRATILSCLILFASSALFSLGGSTDLTASLANLPGLADSPDKGTFVELVKAIGDVYTEGKITIEVFPFARSVNNVLTGLADFHIPTVRNPMVDQAKLPYGTVKVPMGSVTFVIYSNSASSISKKMLDDAIAGGKNFPYKIDLPGGIENQFPFTGTPTNDLEHSLRKLSAGRIDALIWAQEEVDATLKALKLKNIHREFWTNFDDAIIIPKGAEGDKLDRILSDALTALKKSGKLEALHSRVHHSYDTWQPAEMGW
jgi:polar amino acid transport system substrate-binding protein